MYIVHAAVTIYTYIYIYKYAQLMDYILEYAPPVLVHCSNMDIPYYIYIYLSVPLSKWLILHVELPPVRYMEYAH